MQKASQKKNKMRTAKVYIFHRGDKWYPLELKDDKTAIANAKCNPGTTKVTTLDKRVVWPTKMNPSEDN